MLEIALLPLLTHAVERERERVEVREKKKKKNRDTKVADNGMEWCVRRTAIHWSVTSSRES